MKPVPRLPSNFANLAVALVEPSRQLYDFEPLGTLVIIEKEVQSDLTPGGIVVPERANQTPLFKVVAVGPGDRSLVTGEYMPLQVKPGDLVVFCKDRGGAWSSALDPRKVIVEASTLLAVVKPQVLLDS